jgi:hypothetical protein
MTEPENSPGTSNGPTAKLIDARASYGDDPVARNAVDVDVSWLVSPDLPAIDVLARLQVVGRRCGRPLWLHGATTELVELLELVGLREIVHLCPCAGRSGDRCCQTAQR